MTYDLIKYECTCQDGMYEVNDAHRTGNQIELSDSPTSVEVIRAIKSADWLHKPINNKTLEVDLDNEAIYIRIRKSGKWLFELRPIKD